MVVWKHAVNWTFGVLICCFLILHSALNLTLRALHLHVRSDGTRNNPCKAARHILVLLGRLDTRKELLDAHTDVGAAGDFLDLGDGALLVALGEGARLL